MVNQPDQSHEYRRRVSDVLLLPYHQDERLDERSITLPADVEPLVVDPELPTGSRVAAARGLVRRPGRPRGGASPRGAGPDGDRRLPRGRGHARRPAEGRARPVPRLVRRARRPPHDGVVGVRLPRRPAAADGARRRPHPPRRAARPPGPRRGARRARGRPRPRPGRGAVPRELTGQRTSRSRRSRRRSCRTAQSCCMSTSTSSTPRSSRVCAFQHATVPRLNVCSPPSSDFSAAGASLRWTWRARGSTPTTRASPADVPTWSPRSSRSTARRRATNRVSRWTSGA